MNVSLSVIELIKLDVYHGHLEQVVLQFGIGDLGPIQCLVYRDLLLNDLKIFRILLSPKVQFVQVLILCQDLLVVLGPMNLLKCTNELLNQRQTQICSAKLVS